MARASSTRAGHRQALNRFDKWLRETFNTSLHAIKKPVQEYYILLYFTHALTRDRNKGKGILLKTINNELGIIKNYCRANNTSIPLDHYTLLETFLQGIKNFHRNRFSQRKYIILKEELEKMLDQLTDTFEDRIWHLAITLAWTAVLRTGE